MRFSVQVQLVDNGEPIREHRVLTRFNARVEWKILSERFKDNEDLMVNAFDTENGFECLTFD